jgi:hypothetical protein
MVELTVVKSKLVGKSKSIILSKKSEKTAIGVYQYKSAGCGSGCDETVGQGSGF